MSARRPIGAPGPRDLHRLRAARREARAAVAEADARCAAERLTAFRRELAATVRVASPILMSLLEAESITLRDIADRLVPTPGWPSRPRLSRVVGGWWNETRALRDAMAAYYLGHFANEPEMLHATEIALEGIGRVLVKVVGHSLEVKAKIGTATFETRHGELRITILCSLPLALAAEAKGRLLDDLLLSPVTADRGWRVEDVEHGLATTVILVVTGNVPCVIA